MKNKRMIASLSAAAMVMALFSGCSNKSEVNPPAGNNNNNNAAAKKIKVGLSTDEGGVNDKSFNQAADTGINKAKSEFGLEYKVIESKAKEDYESNLEALISDKADLLFGVGYQMEQAVANVSKKFADRKFVIIDAVVSNPNVVSYGFREEEGSFLMGVIAGKMTKSNKVGFIGGKDFELINKFEAGFAAGVKAVNAKAGEELLNRKAVKYADSFVDAAKGKVFAQALINDGCDVIYHAAGGVGEGMFQAISEAKTAGKTVWGIGVDMDQAVTLPKYASVILSSMIKRVDTATYDATKSVVNNTFKGGTTATLGLKEEGVGIAPTSDKNTPKDVLDIVNKAKADIVAGKIKVPTKPADVKSFTAEVK